MTIAEALAWARASWAGRVESPQLDAEVLLARVLGRDRAYLYTWPEASLTPEQQSELRGMVERRGQGWPVAYLTGRQEFWSLPLEVSPDVLIPRPETELLVEHALRRLAEDRPVRVLDLGTGSGAIALAVAHERPLAAVLAVDSSPAALALAAGNARRLKLLNIEFRAGSWYEPLAPEQQFDLIVSNPPYIGDSEPELRLGDCRFEPPQALIAADGGLAALRAVLGGALARLRPGAWILVEHGYGQGREVRALATAAGLEQVETIADLQGHPRVTLGCRDHDSRVAGLVPALP